MDDARQAVDAVRDLLPAWTGLGPLLLWVPSGFACAWLATWVTGRVALRPLDGLGDAPWMERARVVFPASVASAIMGLTAAASFALFACQFTGPLAPWPPALLGACVAAAGLLGSFAARSAHYARARGRALARSRGLRGELYLLLLMAPHVAVTGIGLACLPAQLHGATLAAASACVGAFAAIAWFGGLPLVRLLGGAHEAPARLQRAVAEAGARLGLRRPNGIFTVVSTHANAFAFPLCRTLAFTDSALDALSDDQLEAIAAHELGHLSEPASVRAARAGGVLALLPIALWNPLAHLLGLGGAAALVAACWVLLLFLRGLALRMEKRADAIGVAAERDPGCYARALERVYEANLTPAVMAGKRPTHPHLYDRLRAAGVEPDYARPDPPSRMRAHAGVAAGCVTLAFCAMCVLGLPNSLSVLPEDPRKGITWSVALSGGSAEGLFSLALVSERERDAIVLLRASSALDSGLHYPAAYLAELLGDAGRCEESEASLVTAEARLHAAGRDVDAWLENARLSLGECWEAEDTEREA